MDFHEIQLEKSPESKANLISRLFLLWLLPFLRKGAKNDLNARDVYKALPEDSSSSLGSAVQAEWDKERKRANSDNKQPKLWRVVRRIVWKKYLVVVIVCCFDELFLRTVQPLALKNFIRTFRENTEDPDVRKMQFLYAAALVACTVGHAILFQKLINATMHMGMKMRLGISSIIYRKILRLRKADSEHTNVGKLINLLSSDVSRLDQVFNMLHCFIVAPFQLTIFSYLLWNELGVASLGGVGCILFILPLQVLIGRFSMYFRTRIAQRTDERGRFLNEIISGIRLIKIYAWEKPFASVVAKLRRNTFAALILYVTLGNTLTADKAFFSVAVFSIILQAIMNRIPNAASQVGECMASLNRFELYLLSKESLSSNAVDFINNDLLENGKMKQNDNDLQQKGAEPTVVLSNYSASWTDLQPTLKNLNVSLEGNKLIMVVGHVGSGKSSFLNAILSELPVTMGNCHVHGRLSYASQEAWIFPSSLRQNILFGLDMNTDRYWKTIELSCLSDDLKQFPDADLTLVGERGVALSGGQKARVNLARAIYQDAEIYLLDDPLSAVDTRVSKSLFNDCIKEYLDGKLRILVTHQLQYLPFADHIIVLNRDGGIWSQGTYEELKNSGIDFASLIDEEYFNANNKTEEEMASEGEVDGGAVERRQSTGSEDKTDLKSENNGLLTTEKPIQRRNDEQKDVGSVGTSTYVRYFKTGGSYMAIVLLLMGFVIAQSLHNFIDYWLSLWTNSAAETEDSETFDANFTSIKNSTGLNNLTFTFSPFSDKDETSKQTFYAYVYCGLVRLFIFIVVFRSLIFFWYCMRISINLHDGMFQSLVQTHVLFFDNNPSGRIMNRFTKDLNHIDEHLPIAFFDFVHIFLSLLGMIVINVAANYYTAIPSAILLLSLWKLRGFYLSSARDLKRLESLAKSPMFTHVTMTVQGLTTVRALKAESRILEQFEKIQDAHTAVYYMMFVSNRWFALWLEMMSSTFLAVVSFEFLLLTISAESGSVGVALSTIMSLAGALQWGIRQSAETENYMTACQRIFEYCNLKPEAPLEKSDDSKLQYTWPNQGAGKSSLLTALFRLTEPEGIISIDDVSIHDIGLHALRSKISIIPQDPVLFTGSLRYNLDPFDEFVDDQLWRALQEVDLHHAVQSLDQKVANGGSNFSVGQRLLVCLASAILRKNQILVLDEATANVDPATDHLVQQTIRAKFSEYTILTIAHRLQSVLDSDRIMVLDVGKIVEFDRPDVLLQNDKGAFSTMMKQHSHVDEQTK